ncbi:MAG: hypothetical protein QOI20_2066, partial [Acidimicrobiaceae bacterium]|jgi:hypothetical protein|nr:hypothetical protein [Acidimicrobiaceae bacterium]
MADDQAAAPARDRRLQSASEKTHRRSAGADPDGVAFRWVVHAATGERGRALRATQAKAIKELLEWLDQQEQ